MRASLRRLSVPSRPLEAAITSEEIVRALSTLSLEKKAENVVILDVERLVNYCDYFVICSGTNSRQVRAIAQHCMDMAESDLGVKARSVEGLSSARWILVDFGDVIMHVFDRELRDHYDLDGLWGDARRTRVEAPPPAEIPA